MTEENRSSRPTQEELRGMLDDHERWLASDGKEGRRAFAASCDLSGFDLRGANLARATFAGVNLRGSNLEGARLTAARGLTAEHFAGANLADAELPDSVGRFETLPLLEELSKSSKGMIVAILGASAYCWLTLGTTMDVRLLANTGTSPLPILQTNVPIASFYWIVPVALLVAYIYLHLHLLKLWHAVGSLPAVFPNSMRLDQRLYPWLLSNIACSRLSAGESRAGFFRLETVLAEILVWWSIPITTAAFWLRYLSRHEWRGTLLHVLVVVTAITAAVVFRTTAYAAIAGHQGEPVPRRRVLRVAAVTVAAAAVVTSFSALALGTRHFQLYGATFFPDLRGAHLTGENLRGVDMRAADASGAVLDAADVRDARLEGVLLGKSNLRGADLRNSSLDQATLVAADLRDARLEEARLNGTNLQSVRINDKTRLQGAHLEGADLRNVDLTKGNLEGVYMDGRTRLDTQGLRGSSLKSAVLNGMVFDRLDIRKADLKSALLEGAQFKEVRAGKQTHFDLAAMRRAVFVKGVFKNSVFDGAKLQDVQFTGTALPGVSFKTADLERAVFRGAGLVEAHFDGAKLSQARFLDKTDLAKATFKAARIGGADFTGAINLTQSQLAEACGDASTKLPASRDALTIRTCEAR